MVTAIMNQTLSPQNHTVPKNDYVYSVGRLTAHQVAAIKSAVAATLGEVSYQIWLFGSRADITLRGGDIDLFIETETDVANRAKAMSQIYAKIILAIGDRKIDILLKDKRAAETPIFTIARQTGILL